jgi:hypothetical protein
MRDRVRHGMAWHGMARHGMAWHGTVGQGVVLLSNKFLHLNMHPCNEDTHTHTHTHKHTHTHTTFTMHTQCTYMYAAGTVTSVLMLILDLILLKNFNRVTYVRTNELECFCRIRIDTLCCEKNLSH